MNFVNDDNDLAYKIIDIFEYIEEKIKNRSERISLL